jgi:hypothetical protein
MIDEMAESILPPLLLRALVALWREQPTGLLAGLRWPE